ncbi:sulfite exporter TauE/SafE family protein [Sciscionella sediminilitoris]|uniref:sulfite exporter TauE/SafE family protein n=1 Tax=Sciscionella sediminilitoris TaxID=1445613 RepID=UPI0004DF9191|nr:sulfite exporter TauE/SafE family protein [Sciscionella sp. SE31]
MRHSVLAPIGLLGGAMGALLGGGTGTVTVPALDRYGDLDRPVIHGTSTIANVAVAAVGGCVYWLRGGAIEPRFGVPLMIGGVFGALAGVRIVRRAPERLLRTVFIAVLVLSEVKLLTDAFGLDPFGGSGIFGPDIRANPVLVSAVGIALGVLVGAWSAALGLGGGLLSVPILVLLFGASLHTAEGTALIVMLPNSLVGAIAHARAGTASVPVGLRLAAGAAIGAVFGALLGLAVPGFVLSAFFGVFVLCMAGREIRRMRG